MHLTLVHVLVLLQLHLVQPILLKVCTDSGQDELVKIKCCLQKYITPRAIHLCTCCNTLSWPTITFYTCRHSQGIDRVGSINGYIRSTILFIIFDQNSQKSEIPNISSLFHQVMRLQRNWHLICPSGDLQRRRQRVQRGENETHCDKKREEDWNCQFIGQVQNIHSARRRWTLC